MRRKYFGWAIAAIATLGPMQAWGGDREIAEQIIERLKVDRDSGALKDFTLDMKVDQGVVLFRGNVSETSQKELLMRAADGIDGVTKVVDEVSVQSATPGATNPKFSFREALASQAEAIRSQSAEPLPGTVSVANETLEVVPGEVMPTGAAEPVPGTEPASETADQGQNVTLAVVDALRDAQTRGELRGFGVDVRNRDGMVELVGQARTASQRDRIVQIAESTPGVRGVQDSITVAQVNAELPRLPQAPVLGQLAPVTVESAPASSRQQGGPVDAMATPYRMQGQPAARPAAAPMPGVAGQGQAMAGAPMMGQPVPMGGYAGAAAPRYDSPYLPNYAWPGYAAYPNYAAVSYPQQYSPSAFPYIGPFYPYPQVPLGWRKVSLEWDDGWWFLDFTDR